MKIGEVCKLGAVYIRADESVAEAARKMRTFHVGDLIVVDAYEAFPIPVGIITDRDIVVGPVAQGVDKLDAFKVGEVISQRELVTADVTEDAAVAIDRMRDHSVRRIPVVDDRGVLVGIFTLDDALGLLQRQLGDLATVVHSQQRHEYEARP